MTAFWLFVYKIARAHLHAKRGPHMVCCECGLLIHRHDRFRVVDVVHINCKDVKLVGQRWLNVAGGYLGSYTTGSVAANPNER